tara:strand:+ start:831 stop:1169 length:339 start_codon:yes stop_codon:yes gene_type:complete
MKSEGAMANFILKEAEHKESLRKRLSESEREYYTGRYLFGLITSLLLFGMLIYFFINGYLPIWGLYVIAIAMIALLESKRNAGRIDAMIKLSELDSNVTNVAIKASPSQQDT